MVFRFAYFQGYALKNISQPTSGIWSMTSINFSVFEIVGIDIIRIAVWIKYSLKQFEINQARADPELGKAHA